MVLVNKYYKERIDAQIEDERLNNYKKKYSHFFSGSQEEIEKQILDSYNYHKDQELENITKERYTNKYYKEYCFNSYVCESEERYELYDRKNVKIYEKMDIYDKKDKTMFAVKFGKASSDLSYAVTQSISSLIEYKNNKPENFPEIKKVGLWLVLEKKTHLPLLDDDRVDLTKLKMLMLLNQLDYWKKQVKLNNLQPIIYINYYSDNEKLGNA